MDHATTTLGFERADVTRHVSEHLVELAELSRRSGLDFLAYVLDVARLQALEDEVGSVERATAS